MSKAERRQERKRPVLKEDLRDLILEAHAVHWGFTQAGLDPEFVFLSVSMVLQDRERPPVSMMTVEYHDAGHHFVYTIAPFPFSRRDELYGKWTEFIEWRKTKTDAELDALVERSQFRKRFVPFLAKLLEKGLPVTTPDRSKHPPRARA